MKKKNSLLLLLLWACMGLMAKSYTLVSPNGQLKAQVEVGKTLTYSLSMDGTELLAPSSLSLKTEAGTWGIGSRLKKASATSHRGVIEAIAYKRSMVNDVYNQLALQFREGFSVIFRLYDEGLAYRFVSDSRRELLIEDEEVAIRFPGDWKATVPYVIHEGDRERQFYNSFENVYETAPLSQLKADRLMFLPLIVESDKGVKLCVTEADVENYPGLYLTSGPANVLSGVSAPYPKSVKQGGYNQLQLLVTAREPYLVKSRAAQQFPWRVISVAAEDAQLLDNDMVYRLASPNRLGDTSWVKPGKVAWEWWNDWGLYGVDFKAGINTETYLYYIDFAARHGIEYVILDEGWAVNLQADLFQVVPKIDLQAIVDYGKAKGVGIILWAGYYAFERDMERVCRHYSEMGVKGFKIDFIDRDDAASVDFHYRAAATAAKYKLLCDFHGSYKPTGLNRTYPNVINFEGVSGLEQNKWASIKDHDQVTYDVTVPFLRMLAGQMDYTQGAMRNGTRHTYRPNNSDPMSQGTRTHQLAEYVVFFSPLNMLCDSPTHYDENPECTEFIARIPVVWDETVPLQSKMGEYVAVARRHGDKWYVGAITGWTGRDLTLDLSPLKVAGRTASAFMDGANADRFAQDYKKTQIVIPQDGKLTVHLASGGGFVMVI